jgi:polyphosphate kinase
MQSERVLRLEVPSREVLDRLATGPLPGGLEAGPTRTEFCRDVYFDTVSQDLERRGVTVRIRYLSDGSCTLAVDVREREEAQGQVVRAREEAAVSPDAPGDVLAGASEPARLLRSMIDPSRLSAQLEVETTRRVRDASFPGASGGTVQVALDVATLRHESVTAEFYEIELHFDAAAAASVNRVVKELERDYGLRVTLATKLSRAREILGRLELQVLETQVRGAREVAVIAARGGRIALLDGARGLRVPTAQGSGEQACRQAMRNAFGHSQAQVRLLGTSAGLRTRPAIEVWLARRLPAAREDRDDIRWVAIDEALALVGSPAVRDPATLTALHMAARVELADEEGEGWSLGARSRKEHPFRLVPRLEPPPAALEQEPVEGGKRKRDRPPPEALLNMELSELAFQERVLALAADERTPLLERVRFLSILGSNLDQFFMTRVAGFHQQLARGSDKPTLDGLTPGEQLDVIAIRVRQLLAEAYRFLWDRLLPDLQSQGIEIVLWEDATEEERRDLIELYAAQLGAVLTPLAADPSHPFPHIRNLRPALAVVARVPETGTDHFAAIELPGDLPRFAPLPGGRRFMPLEEVIRASLPTLYRGLEVVEAYVFRVTRSANISIDEESVADLLEAVQEKVYLRPLGPVVRLEVQDSMPERMRRVLLRELQFESAERVATLREEDVYAVDRLVDLFGLREIAELPFDELHYPPFPRRDPLEADRPIWEILREHDVLVRFPYDSFEESVERLLAEAAEDETVTSIKITLYRTSRASHVVRNLRHARRRGKDVLALVELKASFDEQRNIEWARALESAGIHVVYGPAHLKVHAKVLLVLRREEAGLKRYLYIGTGNLNAATAAGYTDLGLFTTDPELGSELSDVFNALTGYSVRTDYRHLLVAPFNMRERFLALIQREVEHAEAGRGGHIRVKINGLTDPEVILALYRASLAGVRIEMAVRGICCLRPGVPGLSENISVVSILGRFLEHSRIFHFVNAGEPEYFIGSADWRPRNLSRRVEVVTPVHDPAHRAALDEILDESLANPDAWELRPDGSYVQRTPGPLRVSAETYVASEDA